MKKKLLYFLLFMFATFMNSCKKGASFEYELPEDSNVKTIAMEPLTGYEKLRYSDVYSKVEYIQLETNDKSLVSEVSKLEVLDDGKLIVFDKKIGAIVLFDEKGKYINRIGRKGNGHGEYAYPIDIAYDKYHNRVIVYDSAKAEMLIFDMDGKYISSIGIKWFASAFSIIDKKHFCLFLNHYGVSSSTPCTDNAVIIDHSGNIVTQDLKYDKDLENFHPETSNTFTADESDIYLKPPFSSIVYDINPKAIEAAYYIDFGKDEIPREWISGNDWTLIDKIRQSSNVTFLRSFFKTKNGFVLNVTKGGKEGLCFIGLKGEKQAKAAFSMSNDMYGLQSNILMKAVHNNKCYICLEPSAFNTDKELLQLEGIKLYTIDEKGDPIQYIPSQKDKDLVFSINETDNPIIQICTLKEL